MNFPPDLPDAKLRRELEDVLEIGRFYNTNLAQGLLQPAPDAVSALTKGREIRNRKILKEFNKVHCLPALADALQCETLPPSAIECLDMSDEFKESFKLPDSSTLAPHVELDSRGCLRFNEQANRQALTFAYQKYTTAVLVAKEIVERWKVCQAAGAPGFQNLESIDSLLERLAAGVTLKLPGYDAVRVQTPRLEDPLRGAVLSCLSLSEQGDWLVWAADPTASLPERFTQVNAIELSPKQLAGLLKEPLPKEWEPPKLDPLAAWRRDVKEMARGIVDSAKYALRAKNLELPSITEPGELIDLIVRGARGSGDASNVEYTTPPVSATMREALCEVLVLKNKKWTCDWKKLPTSVPPKGKKVKRRK